MSAHDVFSRLNGSFSAIPHDPNRPLNLDILTGQAQVYRSTPLLQWGPRAALAYQMDQKTVVRAGFGIFTEPPINQLYHSFSSNPPFSTRLHAGLRTSLGGVAIAPGVPTSAVDVAVAADQQFKT